MEFSQELSSAAWLIVLSVGVLIGISKTGVPGIGILAVVLMVFAVGPKHANGVTLVLLLVGDVIAVAWYRRHGEWAHLVRMLPSGAIGVVAGYAIAATLNARRFDALFGQVIGGIVLGLLVLNLWWTSKPDRKVPNHWTLAVVVGILAGLTTMLSNAAGPLVILYLLAMGLEKQRFIGTAAWYFLILNAFKVPFMIRLGWIDFGTLNVNLLAAPAVVAGAVMGILFARRIPQRAFRIVIEVVTAGASLYLVLKPWLTPPG
jgi:uncharacterized membrane protein YfcA